MKSPRPWVGTSSRGCVTTLEAFAVVCGACPGDWRPALLSLATTYLSSSGRLAGRPFSGILLSFVSPSRHSRHVLANVTLHTGSEDPNSFSVLCTNDIKDLCFDC